MQETKWNDDEYLSGNVNDEKLRAALTDKRNRSVTIHKPGSVVKLPSGAEYEVQADGSWRRRAEEKR